jgi:Fe-S cluster assembly protein SufD
MSAVIEAGSQYTAEYKHIKQSLPGQSLSWLNEIRSAALAKFSSNGFPSPREEEWRFTNVSAIEKKLFKPVLSSGINLPDSRLLEQYRLQDCWSVVLLNGHFCAELSELEGLPEDVSILGLADALEQIPEQVESYLGKAVAEEDNSFIHFNSAWFSDGLWLLVAANIVLVKPIQLLHIVTQPDSLATTRNLVVAGQNAEVSLIETYIGTDDCGYLTAAVNEVFVGDNAHIKLYKLQTETAKAYHFGGTYVQQQRSGRLTHHSFSFGSLLARNEVHTYLGLAAECELNGLYLGTKRQHIDNHTRIHHQQPHAISRETYKGILDQRARGVFQGRVVVVKDAQKTDSEMHNRNLLLSDNAEADTKPQLEIYADDVKCAHGVTVGQLDEKSIFYLKSRCLDEQSARHILTFAFANEMVDKIDVDRFKEQVLALLLDHFPQTDIDKEWL